MARAGMATLIKELRRLTEAGTNDYTLADETFWTDDQLQAELDKTRTDMFNVPLVYAPRYVDGVWRYYDYGWKQGVHVEEASTTGAFVVRDSTGVEVSSTGYTVNYQARQVVFSADKASALLYLDYRFFNLFRAAAGIWEIIASHFADRTYWSTDNAIIKADQKYAHAVERAKYFRDRAGVMASRFYRLDEVRE